MRQIVVGAAAWLAAISAAWAQPAPDSPPTNFAAVLIVRGEPMSAYLDVNHLERDTRRDGTVARIWVLNVFHQPMQTQDGAVDAIWTQYEVQCGTDEFTRVRAFNMDATGAIVSIAERAPPRPFVAESAIGQGSAIACTGAALPPGQRITDVASGVLDARGAARGARK